MNKGLAKILEAGLEHADDIVEIGKLGVDAYRKITSWVNGDGPRPVALEQLPDLTQVRLARERLEALAEGKKDLP